MADNRVKNIEDLERKKKAVHDSEAKKEKALAELRKANDQDLKKRIGNRMADE